MLISSKLLLASEAFSGNLCINSNRYTNLPDLLVEFATLN